MSDTIRVLRDLNAALSLPSRISAALRNQVAVANRRIAIAARQPGILVRAVENLHRRLYVTADLILQTKVWRGRFDWGDYDLLARGEGTDQERQAALERLAAPLVRRWSTRREDVSRALEERAESLSRSRLDAKRMALMTGLMRAIADRFVPTEIRLGKHWLRDYEGNKCEFVPAWLPASLFLRWLRRKAISNAESEIGCERRPADNRGDQQLLLEHYAFLADQATEESEALEELELSAAEIELVLSVSSPMQRKLANTFLDRRAEKIADAARQVGITPGNARQQFFRLRKKLEEDSSKG